MNVVNITEHKRHTFHMKEVLLSYYNKRQHQREFKRKQRIKECQANADNSKLFYYKPYEKLSDKI